MKIGEKDTWGREAVKKVYRMLPCNYCGETFKFYVAIDFYGNILDEPICNHCKRDIEIANENAQDDWEFNKELIRMNDGKN